MITETRVENALKWLGQKAQAIGEARGRVVYLESRKKELVASLRSMANVKTQAEKDDFAYTHERYREWCDDYQIAVKEYELLKAEQAAREALISVWQTQQKSLTRTI